MKCRKCGELGKRADSCGLTHNVSTAPASRDDEPSQVQTLRAAMPRVAPRSPAPSPLSAAAAEKRRELLAQADTKKKALRSARELRAASFVRRDARPTATPPVSDAQEAPTIGIPEPRVSFKF